MSLLTIEMGWFDFLHRMYAKYQIKRTKYNLQFLSSRKCDYAIEVIFNLKHCKTSVYTMPGNIACDLCGGTDFYCDSGFYYCSECQRQTQDIQERVLDGLEEVINVKKSKKVTKKSAEEKKEDLDRLTSWECYNYIVFGLVSELIELGASANYKSTIEILWFQYLKSLGVVRTDGKPPLLPALNVKE